MKRFLVLFTVVCLIASIPFSCFAARERYTIKISPDSESYEISDMLYGAFIEDISYACDGGLVSNLVNNNSFEYYGKYDVFWSIEGGAIKICDSEPLNENNTHYAEIKLDSAAGLKNVGFTEIYKYKTWDIDLEKLEKADMGFKKGEKYEFSCYIKNSDFTGSVSVALDSKHNGEKVKLAEVSSGDYAEWTKLTVELQSNATEDGGLLISFEGSGAILIDFVELIPESSHGYGSEEWKYVTLRKDMYEALYNMHPAFVRFPGGCLCEGTDLDNLYNWKNTIGPVEQRQQELNLWRDDNWNKHYINTNSMGYNEFFQLCADIGAEPIPILNAALTCQGRNGYGWERDRYRNGEYTDEEWQEYLDKIALKPGTQEFDAYVQDIFDLIEYANGDENTVWGKVRIENGRKEPYNLKYIGIGNENWGDVYFRNFDAIYNAIKEQHPEITVISSSGTWLDGDDYNDAWKIINEKYPDTIVDEHYYTERGFLFGQNERYDGFDRNGAGVFVGEYAATSDGFGTMQTKANIWSAIEEAGYLTGLERNGDIVKMVSYAPTFAKINAQCWTINMLWFDSQEVVLSPDYYMTMLFANNTGNRYIKTEISEGKTFVERDMYESVTVDEENQIIYVKIVNASGDAQKVNIEVPEYNVKRISMQSVSELFRLAGNEAGKCYVTPKQDDKLTVRDRVSGIIEVPVGKYSINVVRIAYGEGDGNENAMFELPDNLPKDKGLYVPFAVKAGVCGGVVVLIIALRFAVAIIRLKKRRIK